MFKLLRPDVLPVADLGLQRTVARHDLGVDRRAKSEAIHSIAAEWRPRPGGDGYGGLPFLRGLGERTRGPGHSMPINNAPEELAKD